MSKKVKNSKLFQYSDKRGGGGDMASTDVLYKNPWADPTNKLKLTLWNFLSALRFHCRSSFAASSPPIVPNTDPIPSSEGIGGMDRPSSPLLKLEAMEFAGDGRYTLPEREP